MNVKFESIEFETAKSKIKDDALEIFLAYPRDKRKEQFLKYSHLKMLFDSRHGIDVGDIFIHYVYTDTETGELFEFNASSWMDKLCRYHETYPKILSDIIFE